MKVAKKVRFRQYFPEMLAVAPVASREMDGKDPYKTIEKLIFRDTKMEILEHYG